jgi:hypothetical protein
MSHNSKTIRWLLPALVLALCFSIWQWNAGKIPFPPSPMPTPAPVQTESGETPSPTATPTPTATSVPVTVSSLPGASFQWKSVIAPKSGFSERACHAMASFKGRLWVVGGMSQFSGIEFTVNSNGGVSLGKTVQNMDAGLYNDVWASDDGVFWHQIRDHAEFSPRLGHSLVEFQGKLWLIAGCKLNGNNVKDNPNNYFNDVWNSQDGEHWNRVTESAPFKPRANPACFVFHGRLWILGGQNAKGDLGDVWSSPDGEHWTLENASAGFSPRMAAGCAEFAGQLWLVGGGDYDKAAGDLWSSPDGKTWKLEDANPPFGRACGPHCFVLGGKLWALLEPSEYTGVMHLWESADGRNWEESDFDHDFSSRWKCACTVFNNRVWITGGRYFGNYFKDTQCSADGEEWEAPEPVSFPAKGQANEYNLGARAAAFNGKLWVLSKKDENYSLYSSANGLDWAEEGGYTGPRFMNGISFLNFQSKLWILDGNRANLYSSSDGIHWALTCPQTPFGTRWGASLAVYQDALWLVGGKSNGPADPNDFRQPDIFYWKWMTDAWRSTDGIHWSQVTAAAPFPPRTNPALYAWDGRLWMACGQPARGMEQCTDIWNTLDGIHWDRVTDQGPFRGSGETQCLSYRGQLWLVQGDGREKMTEPPKPWLWRSKDGAHWELDDQLTELWDRPSLNFLAFQDRLWIIGGYSNGEAKNDVWCTQ